MKKEGKVWIKISGDFATFLKFRSWKRSNIKSKQHHIRTNQIKHIKTHSKGGKTIEYEKYGNE